MTRNNLAISWVEKNLWFGSNSKLTIKAFKFHTILTDDLKINPKTKRYFKLIDILMKPYLTKKRKEIA